MISSRSSRFFFFFFFLVAGLLCPRSTRDRSQRCEEKSNGSRRREKTDETRRNKTRNVEKKDSVEYELHAVVYLQHGRAPSKNVNATSIADTSQRLPRHRDFCFLCLCLFVQRQP
ncbi:hypothetical protein MAPG_00973 [Magnaporthiopsis poae ATCC 64411]|uniref:Secreted protein n=1 Tax=Magnaporthiopsis poae (strain ATCC 64411 / 73-15) TaxID=644358 RepID=A0A0C4DMG6_MAGP6|nr:hypothetical protein MAPG_00973 [Magnaporthiopsis poae ATCC 64411]